MAIDPLIEGRRPSRHWASAHRLRRVERDTWAGQARYVSRSWAPWVADRRMDGRASPPEGGRYPRFSVTDTMLGLLLVALHRYSRGGVVLTRALCWITTQPITTVRRGNDRSR
jgi:hypothetical protein